MISRVFRIGALSSTVRFLANGDQGYHEVYRGHRPTY